VTQLALAMPDTPSLRPAVDDMRTRHGARVWTEVMPSGLHALFCEACGTRGIGTFVGPLVGCGGEWQESAKRRIQTVRDHVRGHDLYGANLRGPGTAVAG